MSICCIKGFPSTDATINKYLYMYYSFLTPGMNHKERKINQIIIYQMRTYIRESSVIYYILAWSRISSILQINSQWVIYRMTEVYYFFYHMEILFWKFITIVANKIIKTVNAFLAIPDVHILTNSFICFCELKQFELVWSFAT